MEVQILSTKIIKPSAATPNDQRNYKVTFFEQLAPKMHIPLLYFYSFDGQDMVDDASKHQQLQKSLAQTLSLYYPLAGRFAKDGLSVNCEDQGAVYMEAQVNTQLAEFLPKANKDLELFNDFFPKDLGEYTSVTTPLVAIQATTFQCGGLGLAVSISHALADGFTMCTFTQDWANMSRLGIGEPSCSFDQSAVTTFATKDMHGIKPPPGMKTGDKYVTKKFLFDGTAISSLREKVLAGGSSIKHQPSRVELATACIWRALILGSRKKHGHLRPSVMSLTMNIRGKTAVAIPKSSFGNRYVEFAIKYMGEEDKLDLHDLVFLIRETIQNILAACAEASNGDELFSVNFNNLKEVRDIMHDDTMDFYWLSSMCRFPQYEVDFSWGKPYLATGDHVPAELVALRDTKSGVGIEAKVSVTERDMLAVESDPDVKEFTYTFNLNRIPGFKLHHSSPAQEGVLVQPEGQEGRTAVVSMT
uniref:BAHD acyltransferase n=1 Tax=Escallonia rubra TaxID=112253 RepID=A0AA88QWG1_9ASTE|nr:hypothetical protein RJ640_020567 [Escallonia rubra]